MFLRLTDLVVNTEQIVAFNDEFLSLTTGNVDLPMNPYDYKLLLTTLLPKETIVKDNEPKAELQELFEQLHKLTGGKGKTVFTLGREKKLNELLTKHRLTKDNLITAATNIGKDSFLQGENDNHKRYGDIDYLLRPDKAAKWSDEQGKQKKGMF